MNHYLEMNPSGIDWLGEIPAHWEIDRMKWSVKFVKNGVWGKEPEDSPGIICVRVADFNRELSTVNLDEPTYREYSKSELTARVLKEGDLLLEKSGGGEKQPVGFVVLFDHPIEAVCSNFIARMPIADFQNSWYWNYLHRSYYEARINTRSIKQTTGIQNLDSYQYLSESSPYPPITEQNSIVSYLDKKTSQIDAAIEKKKQLIKLLQEKRTSIIGHAVTKGLNPDSITKDSKIDWLGEIPAHWEIDRMKWSVKMVKNGVWGSEEDGENDIICVRVADFNRDNSTVLLDNPTFRSLTPSQKENRVLNKGDLLLEKSGGGVKQPVGFVVIYEQDSPAVCSNFIARMPISEGENSRYWNYLHRYYYFIRINTKSIKQTTGIQNLDSYMYLSEKAPYPPTEEQEAIANYLDSKTQEIDQIVKKTHQVINLLNEYRISLISRVVTGKVDVREEAKA